MNILSIGLAGAVILFIIGISVVFWILSKRRIVAPNLVHIVQRRKSTTSYGKKQDGGNVYYAWPSWFPIIGITYRELPVSNFSIDIDKFPAFDKDRVPFVVDVKTFFRIADTNEAAAKVDSFKELNQHLLGIVQGAVRTILAEGDLEAMMGQRSEFGKKFTDFVADDLKQWGVVCTKNIELMDIRDGGDSNVISNIMAKKKSEIEKESRMVVAKNNQEATEKEIQAKQQIELKQADAFQQVGQKKAQAEKEVGIAAEQSKQAVQEQAKMTSEKEMAVIQVKTIRKAEIDKEALIVDSNAKKESMVIKANAEKEYSVVKAQGEKDAAENLAEATKKKGFADADVIQKTKEAEAEGTKKILLANAEGEKEMNLARVSPEITLAKEIGSNEKYQQYLITIKQVEANRDIGIEQAKNLGEGLKKADFKIIANSGTVQEGVNQASKLLSSQTGVNLGATLEGLAQSDLGKSLLNKFGITGEKAIETVAEMINKTKTKKSQD